MKPRTLVLGAGAWGTCLAWLASLSGGAVTLWARSGETAFRLKESRENQSYLPGVRLPGNVEITASIEEAAGPDLVLVAAPVSALRSILEAALPFLDPDAVVVLGCKGLEIDSFRTPSQVAAALLPPQQPLGVLSGPNLAAEVARRLPAAAVVAGSSSRAADLVRERVGHPFFRIYASSDITGVEMGGALKNPIAITAGISDGLGFGANTRAGLITRGLAEIARLAVAAGARAETVSGISGLGDLIATCHSRESRNYRYGFALGSGETAQEARAGIRQVVEGIPTTQAACALAQRHGIEAPIFEHLLKVIREEMTPLAACESLLARPPRQAE